MTSTQDMVRPGESLDLYYYDGETSRKQVFPTTQNTRFVQAFQSATGNQGGSQTFTIPPQNGLQDIVLQFALTVASAPNPTAVPSGWGYALIKQVSFRYGGSSQYFLSGDQILQLALRAQTSRSSVDDIVNLGGNALGPAAGGAVPNGVYTANCVLTLPHNIPSGVGKSHPFPSDCLTQQVQVTVELYPTLSIVDSNAAAVTTSQFSLTSAQFVVQQVMFNNQGDALPRRVDLATNAYAFPAEFCQQKQTISMPVANTTAVQSLSLTGFRSGEVKGITIWLTRSSDYVTTNNANKSPFQWYKPLSVQMTYAGEVFARYELGLSSLMALINGNKSPAVDVVNTAAGIVNNPTAASEWVHLPFAQTLVDEDSHYTLVHGKPITNGIVNLDIATPTAQSDWILNVSYHYNTTLMFSQGTCDYVF